MYEAGLVEFEVAKPCAHSHAKEEAMSVRRLYERIMDGLESGTAVIFLVRNRRGTHFISLRLP